ncbi:mspA family protein [Rhodococcus sp. MTM3W5.2]|uniref:MspA family porin n=1 Tax=Rhodococcus sp. MTM3W5.2 TaxID=1805827 RepID=UPI0009790F47|nr:MspA family porin [Rhodococcus sp. MTM3W5.2]AQA20461.1 mspA family protein [Rhodococcus sp. MTM3W5.2]
MARIRGPRRRRGTGPRRAAAIAAVAAVGMVLGNGTSAAVVNNANSLIDGAGNRVEVSQGDTFINAVPPLDSSPLSREFFHNGYAQVTIDGPTAASFTGTKLSFGYQIGYPVALTGASVQLNTPGLGFELEHTDGIIFGDVFDEPNVELGFENRGMLAGDIIPQQNLIVDLEPGGITDVPLVSEKEFDGPGARIRLAGVHGSISGALGQVTLRPYARVETASGDIAMTYGAPVPL